MNFKSSSELALRNCESAFRNAGLYDAYIQAKFPLHLTEFLAVKDIADQLNLHEEALKRFLNATTFLQLSQKNDMGLYKHNENAPIYTKEPTDVLIFLVENDIANLLALSPQTLQQLEKKVPKNLSPILETAVNLGILYKNESHEYSVYDDIQTYLVTNSPNYIGSKLRHYKNIMFKTFCSNTILNALKENKSQWPLIIGKDIATPFEVYQDDPELMFIFTRAMHQLNEIDNYKLLKNADISRFKSILDLGGGSGALAIALLKLFPDKALEIAIYEHAAAIPLLQTLFTGHATQQQKQQVQYIPGDFFALPEANNLENLDSSKKYSAIFLSWILHDWTDEQCKIILKKAYHHLAEEGSLFIMEQLIEDEVSAVSLSDMTMLLHTQGKERTFQEYKKLLCWSGFHSDCIRVFSPGDTRRQLIIATR